MRDRIVLETAIREAVAKLDPSFGYADSFDEASGMYSGLIWAKAPPILMPASALIATGARHCQIIGIDRRAYNG